MMNVDSTGEIGYHSQMNSRMNFPFFDKFAFNVLIIIAASSWSLYMLYILFATIIWGKFTANGH